MRCDYGYLQVQSGVTMHLSHPQYKILWGVQISWYANFIRNNPVFLAICESQVKIETLSEVDCGYLRCTKVYCFATHLVSIWSNTEACLQNILILTNKFIVRRKVKVKSRMTWETSMSILWLCISVIFGNTLWLSYVGTEYAINLHRCLSKIFILS